MKGGSMTNNQLQYLQNVETRRNNLVVSNETHRHNKAGEGETKRHNLITEKQGARNLSENKRHNLKTEKLSKYSTDKTVAATKYSANKTAEGRIKSSQISAQASKYGADVNAQIAAANRALQKENNIRDNATKSQIAQMDKDVSVLLKTMDNMIRGKELSSKEKIAMKQIYKDLDIAKRQQNVSFINNAITNLVKLITTKKSSMDMTKLLPLILKIVK